MFFDVIFFTISVSYLYGCNFTIFNWRNSNLLIRKDKIIINLFIHDINYLKKINIVYTVNDKDIVKVEV